MTSDERKEAFEVRVALHTIREYEKHCKISKEKKCYNNLCIWLNLKLNYYKKLEEKDKGVK